MKVRTISGWWAVKFDITFDGEEGVPFDHLPESDQEHIVECIKEGYTSGEIVSEEYEGEEDDEPGEEPE